MSRLIAIDTSGPRTVWCGIENGQCVDPVQVEGKRRHDAVLADGIAAWLDAHEWRDSVDAIAVVTGPGGFAGLRVGVAYASGLATALKCPLLPIPSPFLLAAMAPDGLVWTLTRAGGENVRSQVLSSTDQPEVVSREAVFNPRETVQIPEGSENLLPLGEGYERNRAAIDDALGERLRRNVRLRPHPDALCIAAWSQFQDRNRLVSPLDIDVDYGADFQPTPKPQ